MYRIPPISVFVGGIVLSNGGGVPAFYTQKWRCQVSSTRFFPEGRIMKYFFAYHLVNGMPFAFLWAEDRGFIVGGIPNPIWDTVVEITEEEFHNGITDLERQYPLPCDVPLIGTLEPDAT